MWPDDELTCTGTVTAVDDGGVDVDLTCTRQTGGIAIAASATFEI